MRDHFFEKIREPNFLEQTVFAQIASIIVADEPSTESKTVLGVRHVSVKDAINELIALERSQAEPPQAS